MAMNRVQFQRGLSMAEFMQCDGSDERCEAALIAARWPQGFVCPDCDCAAHSSYRHEGRQCWQCSACRHPCSVTSGTVFEASKLRLSTWFLAMHLLTQSKNFISALELERHLGVCYRTAWLVKHKLMEVMRLREEGRQLTGRVEIDDAYLGGQRCGGKAGRGSENKVSFIAAVQTTDDGQADLACLHLMPFTNAAMSDFAATSLVRPLTVLSDGLAYFLAAGQAGVHERTVTGGGRQAAKLQQFWAVNTVLSNLKTGRAGTYHAVKFAKYAHRCLAEFQYRFTTAVSTCAQSCTALFTWPARPNRMGLVQSAAELCRESASPKRHGARRRTCTTPWDINDTRTELSAQSVGAADVIDPPVSRRLRTGTVVSDPFSPQAAVRLRG